MTSGPFLYDDGPAPLHTGEPRQRQGLILAIMGGTVLFALVMVGALMLFQGTSSDQAENTAATFSKALAAHDSETAYGLLCDDETARLTVDQMTAHFHHDGTPKVTGSRQAGSDSRRVVDVRWTAGTTVTTTHLVVVPEGGGKVCGTSGR